MSSEPTCKVYRGAKRWYLAGKLHRVDGPAVEHHDGTKCWYQHGERHRTDGPAMEYASGGKYWYLHDECLTEEEHKIRMTVFIDSSLNELLAELYPY